MNAQKAAVILIGVCGSLVGCGYRAGGPFRSDIQSVHVEMFSTREFRRDLEFMLTEAVKKRINAHSPYRLASRENADTILRGEVLEVRQAAFAPDFRTRLPRDKQMTLIVRLQWLDQRTGRLLMDRPVWLQAVDYLPPAGESEAFAQQAVVNKMARTIVEKMADDW